MGVDGLGVVGPGQRVAASVADRNRLLLDELAEDTGEASHMAFPVNIRAACDVMVLTQFVDDNGVLDVPLLASQPCPVDEVQEPAVGDPFTVRRLFLLRILAAGLRLRRLQNQVKRAEAAAHDRVAAALAST